MAAASLYLIFMFSFLSFLLFFTLSVIIFSLYTILKKIDEVSKEKSKKIPSLPVDDADNYEKKRTQQQKQENAYKSDKNEDPNDKKGSDQEENKRKKKRVKKKRPDSNCVEKKDKEDILCLYPFTKSSSAIQRKIKLQYDQIVKSHESKSLTLAQVGKFVNCLVEARNELQNKSEVIKRKFIITKAILFKADKSSVNRLHQQICKLELEHKRLEDDAFVYNWLQQQLKLSPAYEKMLELGACMEEIKSNSVDLVESTDANFSDISFEELLAQEKKDSFWQRKGRYKPCLG
ncbi:uncharacterized protein LOC111369550 [Olea europaea subsp. europaea]|uniref:Uncharacterized protein LOC111369550 n=2 Tax=Olea europaea subsp. europaea TaxID=158383 RepID=A0A8S0UZF3_OLEEU|nr:uncharacterized protein LOC111369550 [Olea europaea subsp. europaea]